jgi:molybdate transport system regulatory protein
MAERSHEGDARVASPSRASVAARGAGPSRGLRASAKTVLVGRTRFLGPGVVELLRAVEELGSVKSACARIGLSYTKGWRLIHTLEEELGAPCVTRQQGGVGGGRAVLTPDCRSLLGRFESFSHDVDAAVGNLFARHFPEFHGVDPAREFDDGL